MRTSRLTPILLHCSHQGYILVSTPLPFRPFCFKQVSEKEGKKNREETSISVKGKPFPLLSVGIPYAKYGKPLERIFSEATQKWETEGEDANKNSVEDNRDNQIKQGNLWDSQAHYLIEKGLPGKRNNNPCSEEILLQLDIIYFILS